jgi:choline dehydrogenase-like flavoprotein
VFLIYKPEGSDEPQRWRYIPRKMMSAEREWIERRTERTWSEFTKDVVAGSSLCRRALLYVFLKRDHPGVKWDDVDFAWDELTLQYSKAELIQIRETAAEAATGEEREMVLARLDEQIAEAPDDPEDEGKVQQLVAD